MNKENIMSEMFGRMNAPDASAVLKGPCGDEMEFYLVINGDKIEDVKFYTEGCEETKLCGAMAAHLAKGKTIEEALCVSAGEVKKKIENLSDEHLHCTILSVSTFYRAIAEYLLRREYS